LHEVKINKKLNQQYRRCLDITAAVSERVVLMFVDDVDPGHNGGAGGQQRGEVCQGCSVALVPDEDRRIR